MKCVQEYFDKPGPFGDSHLRREQTSGLYSRGNNCQKGKGWRIRKGSEIGKEMDSKGIENPFCPLGRVYIVWLELCMPQDGM